MAYYKQAEEDRHQKEIQEHAAKVVARRQQHSLIPLINPNPTPTLNSNPLSNKDINIKDANNNIRAFNFPSNIKDIREIEIGGPSKIKDYLTILFSNKLLNPLIT